MLLPHLQELSYNKLSGVDAEDTLTLSSKYVQK